MPAVAPPAEEQGGPGGEGGGADAVAAKIRRPGPSHDGLERVGRPGVESRGPSVVVSRTAPCRRIEAGGRLGLILIGLRVRPQANVSRPTCRPLVPNQFGPAQDTASVAAI